MITGASAGVGRATALRFAREGAQIALVARDEERLAQAVEEVREAGGKAIVCLADVADPDAMEAAAEETEQKFGPIDVWVNAAMATVFSPFAEIEPAEFKRATEVTYLGCVHGTMAALRRMKERDRGTIVQVGSALAYRSIPLQAPYCGAKHAIVGFTDSLRSELIHDKSHVKLSMVHLPAVNTPQFDWGRNKMAHRPQPLPPIYQPEVAAEAIHYASLHPRREFWVGGSTAKAIVGQRLIPGILDHYLARKAYDGQQTQQVRMNRSDNLYTTAEGNWGSHGRFDKRARRRSGSLWLSKHRNMLGIGLLAGVAAATLAMRLRQNGRG